MPRLAFGLHITKCAGTSLMTTVRKQLSDNQYFLCSSYFNNLMDGRPTFTEMQRPENLRFIFGHFVHESLLQLLAQRHILLFTGLRSPVERAKSHLIQTNTTRSQGRLPPLTADQYLRKSPMMCDEILRAFPSIDAKLSQASKFERARAVLSLFDYIYDSNRFEAQARLILEWIHIPTAELVTDNVTSRKHMDEKLTAFNAEQCEAIEANAASIIQDDFQLYEYIQPHFGVLGWSKPFRREKWFISAAEFRKGLGDAQSARKLFAERENRHLVYESYLLGKLDFVESEQRERIDIANRTLAAIATMRRD